MSNRPVSVEDIIEGSRNDNNLLSKPKFLSKQQREKFASLKQEKELTKKRYSKSKPVKRIRYEEEEGDEDELKLDKKAKVKKTQKFSFDWDAHEDTSTDFNPLVAYEEPEDDLGYLGKHWSEKKLEDMDARDWRIFKDDYNITAKGGGEISNPLRSWQESGIDIRILDILTKKLGYSEPTPIQRSAIPLGLQPRDLVGIAETGSGKTIAFLIPLLNYILNIDPDYLKFDYAKEININKPLGLILAPTRELAIQISQEIEKFTSYLNYNVVTIIGGHKYEETIHSIDSGVDIVVATPGRLIDSLERGIINLDLCYFFTMDEADRMIDMGFEKSLNNILDYLPLNPINNNFKIDQRITLMFTATITPPIEKITKNYLINPAYLTIGNPNNLIDNIEQKFEFFESSNNNDEIDDKKFDKILEQIKKTNSKIIIFANFKKTCELLAVKLSSKGIEDHIVIHGSKSQELREVAIENFRSNKVNILIATDVAARGLDVPNVGLVINYQMSKKFEEYIHRIGRTGRAGNQGKSYTIIDYNDVDIFLPLKKFLSKGGKKCPEWLLRNLNTQVLKD